VLGTSLPWDRGGTLEAGQGTNMLGGIMPGTRGQGDEAAQARLPEFPPPREASTWLSCKVHPLGTETPPSSACHPRGSHPHPVLSGGTHPHSPGGRAAG